MSKFPTIRFKRVFSGKYPDVEFDVDGYSMPCVRRLAIEVDSDDLIPRVTIELEPSAVDLLIEEANISFYLDKLSLETLKVLKSAIEKAIEKKSE